MLARRLLLAGLLALLATPAATAGAETGSEREEPRAEPPAPAPEPTQPTRRRPGSKPESEPGPESPPLPTLPSEFLPVPDRWRIMDSLRETRWWDPYNFNVLKADRPIFGDDWFLNVRLISDSLFEPRRIPTPESAAATRRSNSLDVFGEDEQYLANQNLILSLSLIQGNTVFRPPDWELRVTGVWNWNYTHAEEVGVVYADPTQGLGRYDRHFAVQEAFVDRHLLDLSPRYDFASVRVGIQPFTTDFRGFLFADSPLGVRFFGNQWNNRVQWNLAAFRRIEKDTNSGLNTCLDLRADDVFVANAYWQDFPVLGFTVQGSVVHDRNREGDLRDHYDRNGFIQRPAGYGSFRPHNYELTYFGLNGDGHFGRVNLMFSGWYGHGDDELNPVANRRTDIEVAMAAAETSIDVDWMRFKLFGLWASGDDDPFDSQAQGWDSILENPNFAGADTSFWQRQAIPLIAGGGVVLSGRNALFPSLRSSKDEGQANFVNPGLLLAGVGADFDLLPQLRLSANASWLQFVDTSALEALRNQAPIEREIGWDLSAALLVRPLQTENVVLRLSGAMLLPGDGMQQLYDDRDRAVPFYSVLANLILSY